MSKNVNFHFQDYTDFLIIIIPEYDIKMADLSINIITL